MKNRKHNCGLFWESFRDLKMIGLTATVLYFIYELIYITGLQVDYMSFTHMGATKFDNCVEIQDFLPPFVVLTLVVVPLLMVVAFRYAANRKMSDFFYAVPHTRLSMFWTKMAAVFAWTLIVIATAFLVVLIGTITLPNVYMHVGSCLTTILKVVISILLVMGAFALGITVTGTILTNITTSLIILLVPRIVLLILVNFIESATPRAPLGDEIIKFLSESNIIFQYFASDIDILSGSVGVISTTVEAVIYLVLATFLYRIRPSETAGKTEIHPAVGIVTRIMVAIVPASIAAGYWADGGEIGWGIFLFLLAIAAYMVYELMTVRKSDHFKKSLKWIAAIPAYTVLITVISKSIIFNINSYTPDLGLLKNVVINEMPYNYKIIKVANDTIIDRDNLEILAHACSSGDNYYRGPYEMIVTFNEGKKTYKRSICVEESEMVKLLPEISAGKIEFRNFDYNLNWFSVDAALSPDAQKKVLDTYFDEISKDMNLLTFCLRGSYWSHDIGTITTWNREENRYFSVDLPVTLNAPKTMQVLYGELSKKDNMVAHNELLSMDCDWQILGYDSFNKSFISSGKVSHSANDEKDTYTRVTQILSECDGNSSFEADRVMVFAASDSDGHFCFDVFNPTQEDWDEIVWRSEVFFDEFYQEN